jgi:hypothetical protein
MDLAPVTASHLQGRTRNWRRALTVTDPNGDTVVRAALGRAAGSAYAVFDVVGGRWRIEQGARSGQTGTESALVLDRTGNTVATLLEGEIVLAGGETLPWKLSGLLRKRCRLGADLWVAKPRGPRNGRFRAELSQAMLAREDLSLLTGIFSVRTHRAFVELTSGAWVGDLGL